MMSKFNTDKWYGHELEVVMHKKVRLHIAIMWDMPVYTDKTNFSKGTVVGEGKFGFMKQIGKGGITTMEDLERWHFKH